MKSVFLVSNRQRRLKDGSISVGFYELTHMEYKKVLRQRDDAEKACYEMCNHGNSNLYEKIVEQVEKRNSKTK